MKLVNKLIDVVGTDKLLHYLIFALIVAWGFIASCSIGVILFIIMSILSILKEWLWDDFFNVKDLIWGVSGGLTSVIIFILKCLVL